MRIVKLSTNPPSGFTSLNPPTGFTSLDDVRNFSKEEIWNRQDLGRFNLTRGRIAQDELHPDEPLLFTYQSRIVFVARSASGLLQEPNSDGHYPNYFLINLNSLREIEIDLEEVQQLYNTETGSTTNFIGQGWNHLADSIHTEKLWNQLISQSISPMLRAEDADVVSTEEVGYNPTGADERTIARRQIRIRRGQRKFRDALCNRYNRKCVITNCALLDILEAAHISPYRGDNDNHPENGLLLRADIHTLYDLNLLAINPDSMQVELHPKILNESPYRELNQRSVFADDVMPSREALTARYSEYLNELQIK